MKILSLDTSTKILVLGLADNSGIYEYNLEVGRKLSSLLASAIERSIKALGWQIKEIDYFAAGIGPGSFTGMRVGVATIKGLAWALKKPVVGISTLDVLASNAAGKAKEIAVVVDASLLLDLVGCQAQGALDAQRVQDGHVKLAPCL